MQDVFRFDRIYEQLTAIGVRSITWRGYYANAEATEVYSRTNRVHLDVLTPRVAMECGEVKETGARYNGR